eukprot:COSAG05_NODE_1607_length_4414_cov_2.784241_1_plen_173_part_00
MSDSGTDESFIDNDTNSNSSSETDSGDESGDDDMTGSEHLTIRKALDESETDPATVDPVHFAICQAAYQEQKDGASGPVSSQRMAAIINKLQLNLTKSGAYKPGSCPDGKLQAISKAKPKEKRRLEPTLLSAPNPSGAGNPPSPEVVPLGARSVDQSLNGPSDSIGHAWIYA